MSFRMALFPLVISTLLTMCGSNEEAATASIAINTSSQYDDTPSQPGHDIQVKLENYDQDFLTLARFYGSKQFVQDTARIDANGVFRFQGDEALDEGVYMIVMAPNNQFLQIIVPKGDQHYALSTSTDSLILDMKVEGSEANVAYYEYLAFLNIQIKEKTRLNEAYTAADGNEKEQESIKGDLEVLDKKVKNYQANLANQFGQSMLGRMMAADRGVDTPDFEDDEDGLKAFYYQRAHYFDYIDLADEGLLRSPVLASRVDNYLKNYIVQHPDSIVLALDDLLARTKDSDNFQYFLIDQVNKYGSSKIVGMDAVFVHLVKNYYGKGRAWWSDPADIDKIVESANTLEPILIGKQAPNLVLYDDENQPFNISQLKHDYTVLLFWDPECSHCEKSMPDLVSFYDEYITKGVEVVAICTIIGDNELFKTCAEKIAEYKMPGWINASDQYHRSQFKKIYDIKTTPRIFILDKDKKIIMKGIGADQLSDVMKNIMEKDAKGV